MFTQSIPLFKIFGFSVKADWSWLIVVVLVTWSLAAGAFPFYFPQLSSATYLAMGIAGAFGLFLSIVLHELGHSLAARRYGVDMRGITLFIFGGVAEMKDEPPSPMAEFVIAIAGPLVSVAIGVACLASGALASFAGVPVGLYGVLYYLGWINLVLVAFNMVPAFPLDGGRVLRALLWHYSESLAWSTRITSIIGSGFGILLIVLGVVSFISGDFIGGMWWFLLGMFLRGAARMSYQHVLVRQVLAGETVDRFMHRDVVTVPPSTTVQEFVDDYVFRHHYKMFPVADNSDLLGCMTTARLKDIPRQEWPRHTVAEMAEPCGEENTIDPRADAAQALSKMSGNGRSRLMVVDNGRLVGIVAIRDMMKIIGLKMELEGR
jgi:Zn-dependent protease